MCGVLKQINLLQIIGWKLRTKYTFEFQRMIYDDITTLSNKWCQYQFMYSIDASTKKNKNFAFCIVNSFSSFFYRPKLFVSANKIGIKMQKNKKKTDQMNAMVDRWHKCPT